MITDLVFLGKLMDAVWFLVGMNALYASLFLIFLLKREKPFLLAGMGMVGIVNFVMLCVMVVRLLG